MTRNVNYGDDDHVFGVVALGRCKLSQEKINCAFFVSACRNGIHLQSMISTDAQILPYNAIVFGFY